MKRLSTTRLPFEAWPEEHPPGIFRFIANESYIVSSCGGGDNNVHVLSSHTGAVLQKKEFKNTAMVGGLVIDGENLIVTNSKSSDLTVYHIPTETILHTFPCVGCKGIFALQVTHRDTDTCIVAAFHKNGSACIWDIRAGKRLHKIKLHGNLGYFCTVIGSKMATSSEDGTTTVSNWQSGQVLWTKKLGEAAWWNIKGAKPLPKGEGLGNTVCAQSELEGGFVVATSDGMVHIFDLESSTPLKEWQAADTRIQQLIPYNDWLISVGWGKMKIWSIGTYQLLRTIRIFDRVILDYAIIDGLMICDGRDAADESDSCGLESGVKTCQLALLDGNKNQTDDIISRFGLPVLATRGVAALGNNRVAIAVGRGKGKWDVDIWEV